MQSYLAQTCRFSGVVTVGSIAVLSIDCFAPKARTLTTPSPSIPAYSRQAISELEPFPRRPVSIAAFHINYLRMSSLASLFFKTGAVWTIPACPAVGNFSRRGARASCNSRDERGGGERHLGPAAELRARSRAHERNGGKTMMPTVV